jgi:hypothetical protein
VSQRVLKHPVCGLVAGALTGGALVAAFFALGFATKYLVDGDLGVRDWRQVAGWVTASFLFATMVWSVGLTLVGCLIWRVLECFGFRGPLVAVMCGISAVYTVGLLWPPTSLAELFDLHRILLAISGGVVGLVIERVAYREPQPPPAPPA